MAELLLNTILCEHRLNRFGWLALLFVRAAPPDLSLNISDHETKGRSECEHQ